MPSRWPRHAWRDKGRKAPGALARCYYLQVPKTLYLDVAIFGAGTSMYADEEIFDTTILHLANDATAHCAPWHSDPHTPYRRILVLDYMYNVHTDTCSMYGILTIASKQKYGNGTTILYNYIRTSRIHIQLYCTRGLPALQHDPDHMTHVPVLVHSTLVQL